MSTASLRARLMKLKATRPKPLTDAERCVKFEQMVALREAQEAGDDLTAHRLLDAWRKAHPGWWRSKESRAFHNLTPAERAAAIAARNAALDALIATMRVRAAAALSSYA